MRKYKSTVIAIESPSDGIYTLTLASGKGKYRYNPGQFLHIAIDSDYDGSSQWPESRCFSIQTSPDDEFLKITYSVKGTFTQQMAQRIQVGCSVWLKLPYGDLFEQDHSFENTIFISGGTGITPFLSLFTDSSFEKYRNPVLYAGFRDKTMHVYNPELQKAKAINTGLAINTIFQNRDGILDIKKILAENSLNSSYFISGPPAMIKNFKNYLIKEGVPSNNVLTDDWE